MASPRSLNPQQARTLLEQTFADHRLNRQEKQELQKAVTGADSEELAMWRNLAFDVARAECASGATMDALNWLEKVNRALIPNSTAVRAEAHFSPGDAPSKQIISQLRTVRASADICVFTITDNHISEAILETHRRGVRVRIVTDNDKSEDRGSDIEQLSDHGVPVRMDVTDHHMHHKFALFDDEYLLTGSYNWTRSARLVNQENVILSDSRSLVDAFRLEFERLWRDCHPLTSNQA